MTTGIYTITHVPSGNIYIGSSVHIETRWNQHRWDLRADRHRADRMQNTYNKYGEDAFRFDITEECDADMRIEREQYYLDTMNPAFNTCKVAGVTTGHKNSPETRAKISAAKMGHVVSPETRAKMSAAKKGVPKSPEHRAKMSAERKGMVASPGGRGKTTNKATHE